jgi:hypothetical protein
MGVAKHLTQSSFHHNYGLILGEYCLAVNEHGENRREDINEYGENRGEDSASEYPW